MAYENAPGSFPTYEPSLRELKMEVGGLKDLLLEKVASSEALAKARGELYEERHKASKESVSAALAAAQELNKASALASDRAVQKQETAQREYNERSNEFRNTLSDQAARLISREEVSLVFKNYDEKIERIEKDVRDLREARRGSDAESSGVRAFKDAGRANIGTLATVIAIIAALAGYFAGH